MTMRKPIVRCVLALACVSLACGGVFGHGSHQLHDQDISLVLGGYNKTPLGDICREISSSMDNEYKNWFQEEFGHGPPENHRAVGHGAPYGESIPHEYLSAIRKKYGEAAVQKVIAKQTELSTRYMNKIMEQTGLPRKKARALMVRVCNAHLAGDLTIDNSEKAFKFVRNFDDICKSDIDALRELFGKTDPYVKEFERRIKAIQKSGMSLQEKAFAYQKLFAEMNFDEALKRRFGITLSKYGAEYDVKEAMRRQKLLRDKYVDAETAYNGKGKLARQKGQIRNVKKYAVKNGRFKNVRIVDVPVVVENGEMSFASEYMKQHPEKIQTFKKPVMGEAAVRHVPVAKAGSRAIRGFLESPAAQGMTAGVLSFAISEGGTIVMYHSGEMEDDEFWRRTVFNAGLATTESLATVCIAAATGGAPGLFSIGSMVVAGIAIDKAGQLVWETIDREIGEFPGISTEELMIKVPDNVKRRRTIFGDDTIKEMERRTKNGGDPLKKGMEEELWNKEHPFF